MCKWQRLHSSLCDELPVGCPAKGPHQPTLTTCSPMLWLQRAAPSGGCSQYFIDMPHLA